MSWSKTRLSDSGYRKLNSKHLELVADVGNVKAVYQPGHTHADALNYELRIDGIPVVIDTGISTYNKTPRRQYERSSIAHNVVVREGATSDSSDCCYEVWGGFRVGRRCMTKILLDSSNELVAEHNGFKSPCKRRWSVHNDTLIVEDYFQGKGVSYIHLASGVSLDRVKVEGADKVEILDTQYSIMYNKYITNKTLAIHFTNKVSYSIS